MVPKRKTATRAMTTARAPVVAVVDDDDGTMFQLVRVLWSVHHAFRSRSKLQLNAHGLTTLHRQLLLYIDQHPGCTAGEASAWLHVHPSTLTGVVRRLRRRGLLERREDDADARRHLLYVTERGRTAAAGQEGGIEQAVADALRAVAADDLASALRVLTAVARIAAPEDDDVDADDA